ncbi:TPA_asm: nuclear targeted protein LntA [Listeria monocytogenes]|uniref:Nuclear targeted protein LntA n=2 Tax=Listeria monocytogenes TaxID=1639 RepID=W5U092_LISMN|nr:MULTISPECIES: nuclear targeted protein LntA [Listeria]EAE3704093.1 nuclear targeted protein LntA [Listeria monocytogenes serotype 1/2b]EAF3077977.1 nuclear targeted protein LntA [Listeria monocytogenes serotype 1/2a]EAF4543255.1 nuclear targeted protein LntA [Listeria monocytogenes serotype 4b]EAG6333078.1 nuclear targeted protein LntA [Listeria monocytogenes CFSAN002346]EAG6375587.1 nuclear targeted protein LntA [Listeria monocytogenes CFSAN002356]EEP3935762.1 nuclear targeted protein Lnt
MKKLVAWFNGLSKMWKVVVIIGAVFVVIIALTTGENEGEQTKTKTNSDKIVKTTSKPKLSTKDLALIKADLAEFEGRELSSEKILKDTIKEESWSDLDFANDNINQMIDTMKRYQQEILSIDAVKRSSEASADTEAFKKVFKEWSDFKIERIQVTIDLLNGKKDSEAAFKKSYPNQIIFKKVRTNKLQTALNNLKVGYELLDSQK